MKNFVESVIILVIFLGCMWGLKWGVNELFERQKEAQRSRMHILDVYCRVEGHQHAVMLYNSVGEHSQGFCVRQDGLLEEIKSMPEVPPVQNSQVKEYDHGTYDSTE